MTPLVADAARGSAAVTVWTAPHATAIPQLWIIWNRSEANEDGTETTSLVYVNSGSTDPDLSAGAPVLDTGGNHIRSAFTPTLTVFGSTMHLVVVKPDGRGTLAHYVYVEDANAWEYNAAWVVQPQTTARPSITVSSDLLYLAFTAGDIVNVCTYTRSTRPGVKYGTWSASAATGVSSTHAPALFTSPRGTGAELHLAVAHPDTLIKEYAMGGGISDWSLSDLQPGGTTNGGVGACNNQDEAFLAAPTAGDEPPLLQYTVWTEDGNTWSSAWTVLQIPVAYGDVALVNFHRMLYLFYIALDDTKYVLKYERIQLHD